MDASVWLRLRYPKREVHCHFWHLATWAEGLIISDVHGYLIKVSLVVSSGRMVEMLLNWISNWKHFIHLGVGTKIGGLFFCISLKSFHVFFFLWKFSHDLDIFWSINYLVLFLFSFFAFYVGLSFLAGWGIEFGDQIQWCSGAMTGCLLRVILGGA